MCAVFNTEELRVIPIMCPSNLLRINVLALGENGAQGVKQGYLPTINTGKNMQ